MKKIIRLPDGPRFEELYCGCGKRARSVKLFNMPNAFAAEVYFIAAMMLLIIIISAVAVFFFFRTYGREKREKRQRIEQKREEQKRQEQEQSEQQTEYVE